MASRTRVDKLATLYLAANDKDFSKALQQLEDQELPDVDNSSFMAVRFSDMLVPPSFPDTVGVIAPNTYLSYVQNKH